METREHSDEKNEKSSKKNMKYPCIYSSIIDADPEYQCTERK